MGLAARVRVRVGAHLLAALADLGARVVRELEQPAEELERVGGRLRALGLRAE